MAKVTMFVDKSILLVNIRQSKYRGLASSAADAGAVAINEQTLFTTIKFIHPITTVLHLITDLVRGKACLATITYVILA